MARIMSGHVGPDWLILSYDARQTIDFFFFLSKVYSWSEIYKRTDIFQRFGVLVLSDYSTKDGNELLFSP